MLNGERRPKVGNSGKEEESFHEIVALLSEILALDIQEHNEVTVGSPPQTNRKFRLTD
jgi:hypothetical protein